MRYQYYGKSDVGLVRANNEDAMGFFGVGGRWLKPSGEESCGAHLIAVVSDGVGGHAEGEVAASSNVAAVGAGLGQIAAAGLRPRSREAVERTEIMLKGLNGHVQAFSEHRGNPQRMAATLTAVWFFGNELMLLHIGDSRAYRYRRGELVQLTQDHTVVGEALRAGLIDADTARSHPKRHVLQRAVGVADDSFAVQYLQAALEPEDCYCICTDGLSGGVPDLQIQKAFERFATPSKRVEALVEMANRNYGKDNISLLCVDIMSIDSQDDTTAGLLSRARRGMKDALKRKQR